MKITPSFAPSISVASPSSYVPSQEVELAIVTLCGVTPSAVIAFPNWSFTTTLTVYLSPVVTGLPAPDT
ncbi:MAG: hypothetical protein BWY28_03154 [bacterium ADurb.Bin236]|nr:MAG: hypothetical protein BWY28_03154 [bacterium ADurb.Bin236]